jgi:hypothetical protein
MIFQALHRLFAFIVFTVSIVPLAFAGPCNEAPPAAEKSNNTWYCWTDSDTVVVFVHGLHSNSTNAWFDDATGSYWPQLTANDPSLTDPAVFLAGFFTGLDSTTFGMREASSALNVQLNATINGHPAVIAKKNILFVAHSLGGILIRDLLTRYKDQFIGKRVGILLVASPSSGSNLISKLSFANAVVNSQMVGELAVGSRYLAQLDDDFKVLLKDPRMAIEGREIFEQYWVAIDPSGLTTWVPSYWKRRWTPLVAQADTEKYFVDPQQIDGSDHITIAKPHALQDPQHQKLIKVYNLMLGATPPTCSAPPDFEIEFEIKTNDPQRGLNPQWPSAARAVLPQYKFTRHLADGQNLVDTHSVARDKDTGRYFYRPRGAFPCRGEKYDGEFTRVPAESKQTLLQSTTSLCFLRSLGRSDSKSASLACREGDKCEIVSKSAGLADPCLKKGEWDIPAFILSARADEEHGRMHWEVPSLETLVNLPEEIRTGFAEFTVEASPLTGLSDANAFSYALAVNGVDLYIDGLPRHDEHFPLDPKAGLKHVFALENLGFTGGTTGYEKIELEFKYWRDTKLLRTDRLVRDDYISYRHAPLLTVTDIDSKDSYQWSGVYKPAKVQAAYEIMLAVGGTKDAALKDKELIDGLGTSFDGQTVIGVVRPGRKQNPNYGTTFGIKLATGQVKSLFTEGEANAICKWVTSSNSFPPRMKDFSYLYKFPAESFSESKDRGLRVGECRKV